MILIKLHLLSHYNNSVHLLTQYILLNTYLTQPLRSLNITVQPPHCPKTIYIDINPSSTFPFFFLPQMKD